MTVAEAFRVHHRTLAHNGVLFLDELTELCGASRASVILRAAMARLRGEPSFNEPEQWFLATFFGGVVGLAYMLVTSIIDWLRGLTFERYENG